MAVKFTVSTPAGTVMEAGTVNRLLLLCSATAAPPGLAADFSVTVQVPALPGPRMEGLQARVDTATGVTRLIVAVRELLLRVAVTVTL